MREKGYILVIGDAMIDHHIYGSTHRVSPEAPVPVVSFEREEWALGAAANVAAHITSAGIPCLFAYKASAPVGHSENGERFYNMCSDKTIMTRPLFVDDCPFTIKTRIWSNGQQVCRIDEENITPPNLKLESRWANELIDLIRQNDVKVVVFSDYNKGTLTDNLITTICRCCFDANIPTILDPKRPTFQNLNWIDVLKPNVREVELTNLTATECSRLLGYNTYLINTLGKDGMAVYRDGEITFSCPTVAQEVVDVCGCGDTVTALLALALHRKLSIDEAVVVANKGASFTIKHKGCYVPSEREIEECFNG